MDVSGHDGCILGLGETEDNYPRDNLRSAHTHRLAIVLQIWKKVKLNRNLEEINICMHI